MDEPTDPNSDIDELRPTDQLVLLAFLADREDFKALVPQIEAAVGGAEIDWGKIIEHAGES